MMTYAEAGRILGIKPESVTRRARNRRWHKQLGNDGVMLVGVPLSVLPPDNPPDILPDNPEDSDNPDTLALVMSLETEVRVLREVIDDLRADRDAWRDQAITRRRWWPF
jgi:hypothetical protein